MYASRSNTAKKNTHKTDDFYSTLAAFALVTCGFSTRLISTPFEQKTEIERGEVGED